MDLNNVIMGLTIFQRILPTFGLNLGDILENFVSPTEHCYGFE